MKLSTAQLLCVAAVAVLAQQTTRKVQPPASVYKPFVLSSAHMPNDLPEHSTTLSTVRTSTTTVVATTAAPITLSTILSIQPVPPQPSNQPAFELSKHPTDACWLSVDCRAVLTDFSTCYDTTGQMPTPNENQSLGYQNCVCNSPGGFKQMKLFPQLSDSSYAITNCLLCMQQSGVNIWNPQLPTQQMRAQIVDFCSSTTPSFGNMVASVLAWLNHIRPPAGVGLPARMSSLTTGTADSPWWQVSLGTSTAIPTQYLSQLPTNWPYTSYAIARRAGQTTSFALTNPDPDPDPHATGATRTVAWVYHSLLWNPRPLYTRPASRSNRNTSDGGLGRLYQPLLAGWTQGFGGATATPGATLAVSTAPGDAVSVLAQPRQSAFAVVAESMARGPAATHMVQGGDVEGAITTTTVAGPASSGGTAGGEAEELRRLWEEVQSLRSKLFAGGLETDG